MPIKENINNLAKEQGLSAIEKNGVVLFEKLIAERKSFLNKKKLIYKAWARIDDVAKTVAFSEGLLEKGWGIETGGDEVSTGGGFKAETYSVGLKGRTANIQEQSDLFGKKYNFTFDYGALRKLVEKAALSAGYSFNYKINPFNI